MKLRYKLVLAMLVVSAAPIGIAGFQALGQSRAAVEDRIREILAKTSRAEAEIIGRDVSDILRSLKLVAGVMSLDTESLSNLEKQLNRVYLLSDRFNAAALFRQDGSQLGPTIFVDDRKSFSSEYQNHAEMKDDERRVFLEQAKRNMSNLRRAKTGGVYVSPRKNAALMTMLVTVTTTDSQTLVLAVELNLESLQKRFEHFKVGHSGFAFLVDDRGQLVFHPQRERVAAREDVSQLSILKNRLGTTNAAVTGYRDPHEGNMLGAFAPVPGTRWAVVVAQPENEALKPVAQLGLRLGSWLLIGLALAGLFGLYLSARITSPVHALVQGARAIAGGELGHKIRVRSRDEIGKLGETFNHMGSELKKHQDEIKRWNIELQDRVDERTRELKETQAQLVHAQKMAAVGELGAGVAHEINNPLMGVLGSAQLLLMRNPKGHPDHVLLADIESAAQRIRSIVSKLLEVSQTGSQGMTRLDLGGMARQVIEQMRDRFEDHNMVVTFQVPEDLPPILANPGQMEQVFGELFENAIRASDPGGTLRISGSGTDGKLVQMEIQDQGCGICTEHLERIFEPFFTSKQEWQGQGLGLSMVFNSVKQNNGKIAVASQEGQGTTFTLTFPAMRRETHLV